MQTNTRNNSSRSTSRRSRKGEGGFSLLEMVVAMAILTVGLLGVAASIGYALMASNSGRGITNTKLLIVGVLEQMETLRNSGELSFDQIANVGQVDNTGATTMFPGFATGFNPVSTNPGPDGIFGTADDLIDSGPDGIYGNADDFANPNLARSGMSREIVITNLNPRLKRIQVTLRYSPNGGETRELVGVSYLNDDAASNYIP